MLTNAHQGYYYQDILGAYFLAKEIALGQLDTQFRFDKKEKVGDRFDDLVINRNGLIFRSQIKYSNQESDHQLCKADLANGNGYDIALSDLYKSWKSLDDSNSEYRICLAWKKPNVDDPLLNMLKENTTLKANTTTGILYQIDPYKLWPKEKPPASRWVKFKNEMKESDRKDFTLFCKRLIIELRLPKASLDLTQPGIIETDLLKTIDHIGIGIYPNNHIDQRTVAPYLIDFVRNQRMQKGKTLWTTTAREAAHHATIKLHFGSIEQVFPIEKEHLVPTATSVGLTIEALKKHTKVVLVGEPGSGKSWLIENLEAVISENVTMIKHYCYTNLDDPLQSKRIQANTYMVA